MKALWISQRIQFDHKRGSGTWIDSYARSLSAERLVQIANVAFGNVKSVIFESIDGISQWILPESYRVSAPGSVSALYAKAMCEIVDEFDPDLIHIWGCETANGLVTDFIPKCPPILLEMQGLKSELARVYDGSLTVPEQLKCLSIKEILRFRPIWKVKSEYARWSEVESELIKRADIVVTQTEWLNNVLITKYPGVNTYRCGYGIAIDDAIFKSAKWRYSGKPVIFFSAAYPSPFKGIHTAVRSVALLKKHYPNIELRIAGDLLRPGIRNDGYINWVQGVIAEEGLECNVKWLGGLDARQVSEELTSASAFLMASFCENCSTSMQEAMIKGTPVVSTFAGGLPSLADNDVSALFFCAGDYVDCAAKLRNIISDEGLAKRLSKQALDRAISRNNKQNILNERLKIYCDLLSSRETI